MSGFFAVIGSIAACGPAYDRRMQNEAKAAQEAQLRELETPEHWKKKLIAGQLSVAEAEKNLVRLAQEKSLVRS